MEDMKNMKPKTEFSQNKSFLSAMPFMVKSPASNDTR